MQKRRDNKKRLLKDGESQRADGLYEYKYTDAFGVRHSIYSWRLVDTDELPPGKRRCESLRAQEAKIAQDQNDGILSSDATLNDEYRRYMKLSPGLKDSTRSNYELSYNKHIRDGLGRRLLAKIRYSDIKSLYIDLVKNKGMSPGSLTTLTGILNPVFQLAVKDRLIRSNPAAGIFAEIKKHFTYEASHRRALTREEQDPLVRFLHSEQVPTITKNIIITMLGTGLRVGELAGLSIDSCDFKKEEIHVDVTFSRSRSEDGTVVKHVTSPKSKAGVRVIPMIPEVKQALLSQLQYKSFIVGIRAQALDEVSGFLFTDKSGLPISEATVNRYIHKVIAAHNENEELSAKAESREPIILPMISSHVLRHSFCTRLFEEDIDPKTLQTLMGHSKVTLSYDVYTDVSEEKKRKAMKKIQIETDVKRGTATF